MQKIDEIKKNIPFFLPVVYQHDIARQTVHAILNNLNLNKG